MMPWALLVCDDDAEPEKVLRALLDAGTMRPVEGGYMVETDADEESRRRAQSAERQRRYRSKRVTQKRDARNASRVTDYDENGAENLEISSRNGARNDRPPLEGGRRYGVPAPENVTLERDARNASPLRDAEEWKGEPLTDAEREAAQQKIRDLRDALAEIRSEQT
jgi:hypothetical protein